MSADQTTSHCGGCRGLPRLRLHLPPRILVRLASAARTVLTHFLARLSLPSPPENGGRFFPTPLVPPVSGRRRPCNLIATKHQSTWQTVGLLHGPTPFWTQWTGAKGSAMYNSRGWMGFSPFLCLDCHACGRESRHPAWDLKRKGTSPGTWKGGSSIRVCRVGTELVGVVDAGGRRPQDIRRKNCKMKALFDSG